MLQAQSQECILEKSMADNRKSSITAKVAWQCAEFYKKSLSHLESSRAGDEFGSSQVKVSLSDGTETIYAKVNLVVMY